MASGKAKGGKRTAAKTAKAMRKPAVKRAVKKAPRKTANKAPDRLVRAVRKVVRAAKKVSKKSKPRSRPAAVKTKDGRPPNWPALSPYMSVRDAAASLAFYEAAFGFKVEGDVMRDGSGQIMHVGMRLGDACIMFAPQGMDPQMRAPVDSAPIGLSLYVYVPDVDALTARALRAGADIKQAPADQFWGDRIAIFIDPDGYHWTFATNVGEFDASKAPH